MTSSPQPVVQTGGEVTTITLNSPANRNALSRHALRALRASLQGADADPAVRAVVVAAAGPVFCSGADRAELGDPVAVAELSELTEELVTQVTDMTTPVLCRVQGDAYGAGLALVAAADVAVTMADARFALLEVFFGLVATAAIAAALPRIGLTAGLDLLLTGRPFDGREAVRNGLVAAAATDEDELEQLVAQRAAALTAADPGAVAATKRLARTTWQGARAGMPVVRREGCRS